MLLHNPLAWRHKRRERAVRQTNALPLSVNSNNNKTRIATYRYVYRPLCWPHLAGLPLPSLALLASAFLCLTCLTLTGFSSHLGLEEKTSHGSLAPPSHSPASPISLSAQWIWIWTLEREGPGGIGWPVWRLRPPACMQLCLLALLFVFVCSGSAGSSACLASLPCCLCVCTPPLCIFPFLPLSHTIQRRQ